MIAKGYGEDAPKELDSAYVQKSFFGDGEKGIKKDVVDAQTLLCILSTCVRERVERGWRAFTTFLSFFFVFCPVIERYQFL
mgnify:CR=1 FL=1